MRIFLILLIATLTAYSCNKNSDHYTINVDLEWSEGKWVKLRVLEDREYVTFDSVFAAEGSDAVMIQKVPGVRTMYLNFEGAQGSIRLLIENADYTISGTISNPEIETTGKAQNDLIAYDGKLKSIKTSISETRTKLMEASDGDDQSRVDSLREEYYSLYEEQDAIDSAYIAENPSSYATVLALRGTFYKLDIDQLETALYVLDSKLQQMEEYKYMNGKLDRMKAVAIGQSYTDFGLETPGGEILKVSDVQNGNVLLIDFWASWCGPCRRANPELVEIYKEYHDRGFEILGVSLDRDSASWLKAIEDDNLTWPQISDLKYWNCEGAVLYGVPAIPHAVLIDRDGIITAKKLHGDELRDAIESLL